MKKFKTEQENFWAGSFGDEYINRNQGRDLLASNLNFFTKAFHQMRSGLSLIEFGANIGMNLRAIQLLFPNIELSAIEINNEAVNELKKIIPEQNIHHQSILEFNPTITWDVVVIKGVLIHINPDELQNVYKKLVDSTCKYLLIAEYFNPSPVSIPYRGHANRLFKRDFAGEIMDKYSEMKLVDYGFGYHRDPNFPVDDVTWFLMEKTK